MIYEITADNLIGLLPLFERVPTHGIAASACRGLVPCRAFADNREAPTAAVLVLQRFGIGFVAGDARHAPSLLDALRGWHPWYEIADPPDAWHPQLCAWSPKSHATVRYAFDNDPARFDPVRLAALSAAPDGCQILPYDCDLLAQALAEGWSEDQLGAFSSPEDFLCNGFGVVLLREGKILAGCSSFCRHSDGYEIQVDTHPEHRGKGYATAVSAAFILAVLRRGMRPYWDAANATSMRLAQKLGFVFQRAFPAWVLITAQTDAQEVAKKVIGD